VALTEESEGHSRKRNDLGAIGIGESRRRSFRLQNVFLSLVISCSDSVGNSFRMALSLCSTGHDAEQEERKQGSPGVSRSKANGEG